MNRLDSMAASFRLGPSAFYDIMYLSCFVRTPTQRRRLAEAYQAAQDHLICRADFRDELQSLSAEIFKNSFDVGQPFTPERRPFE